MMFRRKSLVFSMECVCMCVCVAFIEESQCSGCTVVLGAQLMLPKFYDFPSLTKYRRSSFCKTGSRHLARSLSHKLAVI